MNTFLEKSPRGLEQVALWLARGGALALGLMMLFTFFDVIGRYFFNQPLVGTVEVTELLMGLIVYLGVGYTTLLRGHIRVDILITHLPPRPQALLELLTLGIGMVFTFLMGWQLWRKAADTAAVGDVTQLWELPVYPVAYVMAACTIPLGGGLLVQWLQAFQVLFSGEKN